MAKEQRRYHHGDLRRTLVDAALRIVEQAGPGALSLRELARRAGVSHAAPYRHFASREALLEALAIEGFRGLGDEMQACGGDERDPLLRFRALGVAYVRYAVAHPGHFKVMFSSELHEAEQSPELRAAGEPTLQALVDCLAEGQRAGVVRDGEPAALAVPAWSIVHGIAMLLIDGQLAALVGDEVDAEAQARAVIDVLAHGLAKRAPKKSKLKSNAKSKSKVTRKARR
ncbi:MAG: TetR family transcriptional regulator [Myxococcales bacterium]|nr:TetR family transcriptional regulator [Myxococcales bacterium]